MARRGASARRTATEWGVRALMATAVAMVGGAGIARTLAYTMRAGDPARAHALAPSDGRIAAVLSHTLSGADATPADRARADRLARGALLRDPTAVAAVATLGIDAQVRGDTAGARRLFGYADRLSRRDLQVQIWGIEDSVGRGDVAAALRHYDIALRTNRNASTLLFPVLGSAIADPPVRAALTATLAKAPAWGAHFINYAAVQGPDPRATASLFDDLRRARIAVTPNARAQLVDRLIGSNLPDEAWAVRATTLVGADRRLSRDPTFRGDPALASRLDWTPVEDGGIDTSIQRSEVGGIFAFSAPPGVGGVLLRQVQVLPPGIYRLDGHSARIEQSDGARPYWMLACSDGRELGRVPLPNSVQAGGVFAGEFDVPAGCPVQTLSLIARASDAVGGLSGEIRSVRLHPAR